MNDSTIQLFLIKYCECGCGETVNPDRHFLPGHNMKVRPPIAVKFWEKVKVSKPDDCWPWDAYRDIQGYGTLRYDGQDFKAHRLSWQLEKGPIPDGVEICHHCDNPPCCNPAHLFVGTRQDNKNDEVAKGRHIHGSSHPDAKLTEEQVRMIRQRFANGEQQVDLAVKFGITQATISKIVLRRTWKHIT